MAPSCWRCRYCEQAFGGPSSRQEHEIDHQKARKAVTASDDMREWLSPIYNYVAEGHSLERAAAVFGTSMDIVQYALVLHGVK